MAFIHLMLDSSFRISSLVLAASFFGASAPCEAAAPQATYAPVNPSPLSYRSALMTTGNDNQVCNVFLPNVHPPTGGFPVVVSMGLSRYTETWLYGKGGGDTALIGDLNVHGTLFDEYVLQECLENGIAVVHCSATILNQVPSLGSPCSGGAAGNGSLTPGVFYTPGLDVQLGGTAGTIEPYRAACHNFSEKDAVMAVQYVRFNAQIGRAPFDVLNASRMAVHGDSAGAASMHWVGYGPDWSVHTFPGAPAGSLSSTDTRVKAVISHNGPTWYPIADPSVGLRRFPRASNLIEPCVNLADADQCVLAAASAHRIAAGGVPTVMYYREVVVNLFDYSIPSLHCSNFQITQHLTSAHSAWYGLSFHQRFPNDVTLLLPPAVHQTLPSVPAGVLRMGPTGGEAAKQMVHSLLQVL